MVIDLKIKPLSVNAAWRGRRFKTKEYTTYEKKVLLMLPKCDLQPFDTIKITYGFSNAASDVDNPTKLIVDLLQKKYGFNDKQILNMHLHKKKVAKGEEYIRIIFG
jgi:Holliday junction resolvase RusA-like endonuclease